MQIDEPQSARWFEERIAAFEAAWQSGSRPKLAAFLTDADDAIDPTTRRELLLELIQVDLEFRWRNRKRRGPLLEWYRKQFPDLGSLDTIPLQLVGEEYRVRRRWGDGPSHSEYVARFPRGGLALTDTLASVDVALADEGQVPATYPARNKPHAKQREPDPDAPLSHADYHLKRQIGSGGMSRVYTAVQVSLDKPVAIKVLRKERLADALSVQRFRREARLTASLRGPGIVDVHGLGRLPDGGYFMVLDLIAGSDLSALGAITPQRAAKLVSRLAETLTRVHRSGVVHCDLKPANVLVDSVDNVYLTDFGLARSLGGQLNESVFDDHPAGTPGYMAPEQLDTRFGEIGPWTDVYGLGGLLHSLLFGQPPHSAPLLGLHLPKAAMKSSETRIPNTFDTSAKLRIICSRCLSQLPKDRYPTTSSLLADLWDESRGLAQSLRDTKMQE